MFTLSGRIAQNIVVGELNTFEVLDQNICVHVIPKSIKLCV